MTDPPSSLPDDSTEQTKTRIPIHQEKSALFRVVHADGVWWSVNAWNNLYLTFYSERPPLPQVVYLGQDASGNWVEIQQERVVKKGWFREMEVSISLTPNVANVLQDALNKYSEYMKSKSPTKPE